MVRSIEHYPSETIVVVHAKLRKALKRVKNATIHDYEFEVYEVHKVGDLTENVPFTVYDAENINRERDDDNEDEEDDSLFPPASAWDTPKDSVAGSPRSSLNVTRASSDVIRRRSMRAGASGSPSGEKTRGKHTAPTPTRFF